MPKIRGIHPDFWTDENVVELSPFARLLWIGLWNHACDNGHLQDKSKQIKMRILPTDDVNCAELLREIEGQKLIERAGGWITIPNLAHHQKPHKRWWKTCEKPGCELPEGASHAPNNRGTTVAPPKRNRGTTADVVVDGDVDIDGDSLTSGATAPDPSKSTSLEAVERPDVDRICDHLVTAIEANGSKRPTITAKWLQAARLMLDKDGRTEQEVHGAIEWSQRDEFWRSNILSLPTLREKYDTLRLQAQRNQRGGGTARQQAEAEMWDRAYARADQREAVQR